jgi:hypothetical protein
VVLTTTDIGEGTNLYFTDARARTAISGGTGISYNNTTGTITNSDLGSSQNIFKNFDVAGQSTVSADTNNDTLTLVAGTNISITTNATTDTITINSTDAFVGTVTSVGMSAPTGFTVSGTPVTSSGTLGLAFAAGYSLPTDSVQADWTTSYNRSLTAFAYNTSTGALTLTKQDTTTLIANVTLAPFSTTNLAEGTNLYFTDARARTAISLTTSGTSGAATYNNTTGVFNIPQYQAALTNPVTGTGTTNYVAKWSSSSAITDSLIFDNGTNVGISNATPGEKLDITGNARVSSYYLFNGNPGNPGGSTASIYDQAGVGPTISGLNVAFRTGSTPAETMRITNGGTVGIGTTAPKAKLQILGPTLTLNNENSYAAWVSDTGDDTKGLLLGYDLVNDVGVIQAVDQGVAWKSISIASNGGNVSIGTTTNSGARTNIFLSEAAANPNAILRLQNTGSQYLAKMILTDGTTNDALIGYQGGVTSATQYLGFGLGTAITQMVLTAAGNVGIGTTAPIGLLHLYKAAATTRMVMDGDAGQSKIITYRTGGLQRFGLYVNNTAESGANAGSDFAVRSYNDAGTLLSTPLFIKRSTGNVGIGTVAPGNILSISQTNTSSATTLELTNTSQGSNTTKSAQLLFRLTDTVGTVKDAASIKSVPENVNVIDAALTFSTRLSDGAPSEKMRIAAGGNVLIATTTDAGYKLRVTGSSFFDAPILCYTGNAYITALTNDGVGSNDGFGYSFLINNASHEIGRLTGIYETSGGGGSGGLGFWTRGSGTLSRKMSLNSGGTLTLSNYGTGSKTGTVAYNLAVDASGNVIETPGGVVDGSGTANTITKWQDANTVTNSSITDDGTTVTATAANFVSQSNLGTAYTSFSTSGTTAIFDTITRANEAIYQIVIVANPNSAGSSAYADFYYGKVFIGTGFSGSAVTNYINYHQESPLPRGLYGSGGGDLTVTAVMNVGGSEVTSVAAGTSYTIRIKIAGYVVEIGRAHV